VVEQRSAVAGGSIPLGHCFSLVEHVGGLGLPQLILGVDLISLGITAAATAGGHIEAKGIISKWVVSEGVGRWRRLR
jgi:hypothetical protein